MNSYERVKRAIEFTGPDRLPIAGDCMQYAKHGDVIYHFPKMSGYAWWRGDGGGTDEWGCQWETNRQDDMGQLLKHPLEDIAGFKGLPRPNGADQSRYEDLTRELPERPDAYHVFCNGSCLFERMHFLRGFDQLLMDMALYPEEFKTFADWVVHYQEETIDYLAKHFAGRVHALRCTDDLGTQINSIMSPGQFRELLKPFYGRVARLCHDHGMHFWLHSCGKIDGLLDDLIEAGVDVINMFQPNLFNLEELGRRFAGRIAFENYPDVQLSVPTGRRDVIRADIAEQLARLAAPKGGYIAAHLAPSHLKAQCNVADPGMADYITAAFAELDPFAAEKKDPERVETPGANSRPG